MQAISKKIKDISNKQLAEEILQTGKENKCTLDASLHVRKFKFAGSCCCIVETERWRWGLLLMWLVPEAKELNMEECTG